MVAGRVSGEIRSGIVVRSAVTCADSQRPVCVEPGQHGVFTLSVRASNFARAASYSASVHASAMLTVFSVCAIDFCGMRH